MLSPPASTALCHNGCVALGTQHIHHEGVGRQDACLQHGEDTRVTARDQCNALVIDLYRLLLVSARHIPEHHFRQLVAMLCKKSLRILKVGQRTILGTVVELHVRDDVDLSRHILLRHAILHCSFQNQLKHALDVGIGHFVELVTVPDLFVDILTLDLNQLGVFREGNEMVLECAGVTFGIVNTQIRTAFSTYSLS